MTIDQERAKIEAEIATLTERMASRSKRLKKLDAEQDEDRSAKFRLQDRLEALAIKELIGQPGAVRIKYRRAEGHREAHLNDALGTVESVGRTLAAVLFHLDDREDERWRFPFGMLTKASEKQGADMGVVLMPAFD